MRTRVIWAVSVLVFFALLWAENHFSQEFQSCINQARSRQSTNNPNKGRFIVGRAFGHQFVCSVDFLDRHDGFVAALASVAVACFTFTLKRSTDRLWAAGERQLRVMRQSTFASIAAAKATKKSANIAEKALMDSDRPWIFLQEVHIHSRNIKGSTYIPNNFMFSVRLKNVGRSPAFPQRCVIKFADEASLPDEPDYSGGVNIGLRTTMATGDDQETNPVGPAARPLKEGEQAQQKIAFGVVTYKDVHGRSHRTGFAYMIAPLGVAALAWNRPKYEYYD